MRASHGDSRCVDAPCSPVTSKRIRCVSWKGRLNWRVQGAPDAKVFHRCARSPAAISTTAVRQCLIVTRQLSGTQPCDTPLPLQRQNASPLRLSHPARFSGTPTSHQCGSPARPGSGPIAWTVASFFPSPARPPIPALSPKVSQDNVGEMMGSRH